MASIASQWSIDPKPWNSRRTRVFSNNRQIGPLDVSPIGLGTWAWGNRFLWGYTPDMDGELKRVFSFAVSRGVNLFDTADSYGTGKFNGKSEILLGQCLKEVQTDKEIHIATKFAAYPWRLSPANIIAACRGSLRRLGVDSLSLGQLHWSTANYAPIQEIALHNGLAGVYLEGLVKAVGVSNYGPKQLERICKSLEKKGVKLSSAQIQFSLLSYGSAQKDLLAMCEELGIAVIAYSPLALGILTGKFSLNNVPKGPRGALFRRLLPANKDLLALLEDIADRRSVSMSQVAINWCMSKGTIPIPGVKSVAQTEDNLKSLEWNLSEQEMSDLDLLSNLSMVQNIFQTK